MNKITLTPPHPKAQVEAGERGGPPDPVDVHVGARIKHRRVLMKISQERIAEAVGVTFQQQQKREAGSNRVSASALWRTANFLGVPVSFFFDGLSSEEGKAVADPMQSNEALRLVGAWRRMGEPASSLFLDLAEHVTTRAYAGKSEAAE